MLMTPFMAAVSLRCCSAGDWSACRGRTTTRSNSSTFRSRTHNPSALCTLLQASALRHSASAQCGFIIYIYIYIYIYISDLSHAVSTIGFHANGQTPPLVAPPLQSTLLPCENPCNEKIYYWLEPHQLEERCSQGQRQRQRHIYIYIYIYIYQYVAKRQKMESPSPAPMPLIPVARKTQPYIYNIYSSQKHYTLA
jgi:hypothetical protein